MFMKLEILPASRWLLRACFRSSIILCNIYMIQHDIHKLDFRIHADDNETITISDIGIILSVDAKGYEGITNSSAIFCEICSHFVVLVGS